MATKGMTRRQDRRSGRQQRRQERTTPAPSVKRQGRRSDRREFVKVQANEGYTMDDVRYKAKQVQDELEQFRSGFRRPG